ncbi:MAG: DUF4145 domain-containing protein [Desulfomonilaceae bacterium]
MELKEANEREGHAENPALDILNAWCLLHQGRTDTVEFMLCPFCSSQISPIWNPLFTTHNYLGQSNQQAQPSLSSQLPHTREVASKSVAVSFTWAACPNEDCRQILVKVSSTLYTNNIADVTKNWFAVPRRKVPQPIDELVKDPFAKDFVEACFILDDSPRMSSVLSRRILADLLRQYANLTDYNLAGRIDKFTANPQHPSRLRENLHYLREMGDFGAHTMENDQGLIVDVTREEAEWTLKVVSDLFDYFIVGPEKDRALREAFDKKLNQTGRKPIKKLTS